MSDTYRPLFRFALLSASMLTAAAAYAAPDRPPAADDKDIVVNGQRVVEAKHAPAQGNLDATQPQSLVSQQFVEDVVPSSGDYSQTIKFTPSFSFSAPNGAGGSESKAQVLRGFADGQYNVTMDGIPFGDANDFTHHTTSFFPSAVLGHIDVDRGPGDASTIGYATFGGTIGLNSRALSNTAGGFLRGGYGSFNDRLGVVELQSGAIATTGGTRVLADYMYHETDGALDFAGLKTQQGVVKLSQPLGGDWALNLFGSINHTRYAHFSPITPNQLAAYGKSFGALNDDPRTALYYQNTYNTKITDFEYAQLSGSAFGFAVDDTFYTFYYRNREYDAPNPADPGLPPSAANANYGSLGGGAGNRNILSNSLGNSYRSFGNTLDLSHSIHAGVLSGTLRTGLWWEHQDQDRDSYIVDVTRGFVPDAAPGIDPASFRGKNALGQTGTGAYLLRVHATIDTVQPFVEYVWTPAPGVTVTPGVKYIDFERTYVAPVNASSLLPLDTRSDYSSTLLSVSGNWQVSPGNALYAQVAQGFLAPSVAVYNTASISRNDFKPQQTVNYQLGYVHASRTISFDVAAYYIDFNNYITTATDFSVTPNQAYSINGGGVIYKGIEAQASLALGRSLSLFAAGSLNSAKTKGRDKLAGGDLWVAGAPDHTLSAGLLYDDGKLYGAVLGKRVGPRYFGANRTNLQTVNGQNVPTAAAEIVDPVTGQRYGANRLGAYDTIDLTLGYRFRTSPLGRALKLEFQIQNLFDNRQATDTNGRLLAKAGDAIDPAATTYTYLPPRGFGGTITVAF